MLLPLLSIAGILLQGSVTGVYAFSTSAAAQNAFSDHTSRQQSELSIIRHRVPNKKAVHRLQVRAFGSKHDDDVDTLDTINAVHVDRRSWLADAAKILGGLAAGGAGTMVSAPIPASAASTTASTDVTTTFPPSLCDPSVSTWRNPTNSRIVHIIGTAHISESSAQLAGNVVKTVHPDAVFVELDSKRISRAMPQQQSGGGEASSGGGSDNNDDAADRRNKLNAAAMASNDAGDTAGADQPQQQQRRQNPFAVKERFMQAGAKLIGESIKTMYSKLDSQGFKAGEEFVLAIREGLAINAAIVLGDRDVEVTLRRLTEALSKTDLKKLFASDSELEQSLNSLMPNGGSGRNGGSGGEMADERRVSKEEFSQFVETVKERENVRLVMSKMKESAPELYEAMVGERDAYMARGLATLDQFGTMVAVMGIAHVDGVEADLKERGWKPVSIPCQIK